MKPFLICMLLLLCPALLSQNVAWSPNAPCCDTIYVAGIPNKLLSQENRVQVYASMHISEKHLIAFLEITNLGTHRFTVKPEDAILFVAWPEEAVHSPIDPKSIRERSLASILLRSIGKGGEGYLDVSQSKQPIDVFLSDGTSATVMIPRTSERRTSTESERARQQRLYANFVKGNAVLTTTLFPAQSVSGLILFPRKPFPGASQLRIPIGPATYIFPFDFSNKSNIGQ